MKVPDGMHDWGLNIISANKSSHMGLDVNTQTVPLTWVLEPESETKTWYEPIYPQILYPQKALMCGFTLNYVGYWTLINNLRIIKEEKGLSGCIWSPYYSIYKHLKEPV